MKKQPNILVIGDGAVGGIISAILKKEGLNIELIAKDAERAEHIAKNGLEISGVKGNFKITLSAFDRITSIKNRPDYIFLATKAGDMPQVAKDLKPMLPGECLVVSLQNGIVEEELAGIIGIEHTVGCVVGWGATMHSRAVLEMTSKGEFVIGYLNRPVDQKLSELADILSHVLPVEKTDRILNHLFSKLIINACISTVGAVCGLSLGEMLNKRRYRNLFLAIIREGIMVARAMKLDIPKYAGKLDYYNLLKWGLLRQHIFLFLFGFKYRRLRSSSLQSLKRGKKTEVDYFNGYITSKGDQFNISTPVNDRLVKLVHEIEAGKRVISANNIESAFDCRGIPI